MCVCEWVRVSGWVCVCVCAYTIAVPYISPLPPSLPAEASLRIVRVLCAAIVVVVLPLEWPAPGKCCKGRPQRTATTTTSGNTEAEKRLKDLNGTCVCFPTILSWAVRPVRVIFHRKQNSIGTYIGIRLFYEQTLHETRTRNIAAITPQCM